MSINKHTNQFIRVCVLFVFSVMLMGILLGDFQKNQRQKVPHYDTQAILKLVSVRVLDQEGMPVMDLTQEDFILYDNNKPKKITEFEVHKLGDFKERPPDYSEKDVIYGGKRKYFILLDIQGSSILGLSNSKKAALHFVETKINPGDEVCVLSYSPMSGLTMQEYLTSDKERIINAIKKAKEARLFPGFVSGISDSAQPARARRNSKSNKSDIGERGASGSSGASIFGMGSIAVATPSMGTFGRKPIDFRTCLSDLTKIMEYVPGNRSVLFFSTRSFGREIGREFASSNTPVFTVNSRRWKDRGAWTVQQREKFKREEYMLNEFAVASGGRYFPDVKNVEAIADTVDNLTANFYVLGYYIDEKWDGAYNKIRVEVKKPGYQIYVQEGYFNPKPFSQLSDIEKKLHLWDLAFTERPAALDPFKLPIELLHCADEKKPTLLILSRLFVDEKAGIPPGKTELFTFIFDKDHKPVISQHGEIDLSTTPQRIFFLYHLASLNPGEYEGRIVVRDMETGQAAVGVSKIRIQEPLETGIRLYTPLLLVPGDEATFVRMTKEKMKKKGSQSIISYYPLLPQESSPLVGHLEEGMSRIWAIIPTLVKSKETPDIEIKVRLKRKADDQELDLESDILDTKRLAESNMDVLLMEIHIPELKPGDYVLEIAASEFISLTESVVRIPLVKK